MTFYKRDLVDRKREIFFFFCFYEFMTMRDYDTRLIIVKYSIFAVGNMY